MAKSESALILKSTQVPNYTHIEPIVARILKSYASTSPDLNLHNQMSNLVITPDQNRTELQIQNKDG